jgi:hypothetical protein
MPLSFVVLVAMVSSCTTPIQLQRTYAPDRVLPAELRQFALVNFYDYRVPDFIKTKDEAAYGTAVSGYATGLGKLILKDPKAVFIFGDTLREGFTVMSMQLPEFRDTVRAICAQLGADVLVALDSINLWIDWDISLEEDDEGGSMLAKSFFLFSNTYITLYTSEGEVIERCAGEKNAYIKTRYTIFGLIGGPTLANRQSLIKTLSEDSAIDCMGNFYPFTETSTEQLYTKGPLKAMNKTIIAGSPEEALAPLQDLAKSTDPSLATKAAHNLDIVKRILEERKVADEVWNNFVNR